jgi:hypothetical protein
MRHQISAWMVTINQELRRQRVSGSLPKQSVSAGLTPHRKGVLGTALEGGLRAALGRPVRLQVNRIATG